MKLELPEYHFCPLCGAHVELKDREGRLRPICSACGHIIYVNPIPAVSLVVQDGDRVLLTLRAVEPHRGEWCLPGGFIEWGESPGEGGKRELLEETGITADKLTLIGVYDTVTAVRLHVVLISYRVLSREGTLVAGDDASDVRWFDIDDMPPLAFEVHERTLDDALSEDL